MKSLKPKSSGSNMSLIASDVKAQIDNDIKSLRDELSSTKEDVENIETQIEGQSITKDKGNFQTVKANNGNFDTIVSHDAIMDNATMDNVTVNTSLNSSSLSSDSISTDDISALHADIDNLDVDGNISAGGLDVNGILSASTISSATASHTFLNSSDIRADTINANTVVIQEFDIDEASINDLTVTTLDGETVNTEKLSVSQELSTSLAKAGEVINKVKGFTYDFTDSTEFVRVNGDYDVDKPVWIELPAITAGWYRITCRSLSNQTSEPYFTVMYWNSSNTPMVYFYRNRSTDLVQFIYKAGENEHDNGKFYIKTYADGYLYWSVDAQNNGEGEGGLDSHFRPAAPKNYDSLPFILTERDIVYNVEKQSRLVLMGKDSASYGLDVQGQIKASLMEVDRQIIDKAFFANEMWLPFSWASDGTIETYTPGSRHQYISMEPIEDDVPSDTNKMYPKWTSPYDLQNEGSLTNPDEKTKGTERLKDGERLINERAVTNYDGSVETEEDDEEVMQYRYPIVHLGDNTTVHGSEVVNEKLTVIGDTKTKHILDEQDDESPTIMPNGSLVYKDNEWKRKGTYDVDGVETIRYDQVALYDKDGNWEDHNNKPIVYNEDNNTIQPVDSLKFDDLEVDNLKVNNNVDVGHNVRIGGDLYVSGTSHIVNEETVSSTGDVLVLRQNAQTTLQPGQVSGILVNKYDENSDLNEDKDLALVTDSDGTLRVGTGTGVSTTLESIAYKEEDGKWYSAVSTTDEETGEVTWTYTILASQPSGTITDYAGKTEDDPYTRYTSVTFTIIDKTSLQPLLTRAESEDLNDQAILKWDGENYRADNIALPSLDGQTLESKYTPFELEKLLGIGDVTGMASYSWTENLDGVVTVHYVYEKPIYYSNDEGETYTPVYYAVRVHGNVPVATISFYGSDRTTQVCGYVVTEYDRKLYKKKEGSGRWTYEWVDKGVSVFRFATVEDYKQALKIPKGQTGYITSGSLIVIDGNYNKTLGEVQDD